jgi:hypothetical protein
MTALRITAFLDFAHYTDFEIQENTNIPVTGSVSVLR